MVAMVVEKMSVEKMYKNMKKANKRVAEESTTPRANVSISAEKEGPPEKSKSNKKKKKKKKKKEEEMELGAEELVEKMPKKKKKKVEAEIDGAVKRTNGGASADGEALQKVHKKVKNSKKKAELEDGVTQSNGGISLGQPLSAEFEEIQDEVRKKKENEEKKKEKKEKKREQKLKRQKTGNKNGNAKVKQVDKVQEPSSDGAKVTDSAVPEPVGMQIYWNLSNVDAAVREAASVALVRELVGAQKDYEDRGLGQEEKAAEAVILGEAKIEEDGLKDCAPAVQYALRRLVRGVASSRESARQGFALALASVLGALPSINGTAVVKMVEKHLEVTSSMKGQEARDALIGQLFAYGALVRSSRGMGRASTVEEQGLARDVTERLLTLGKKKTFLQEAAACVVVELGGKLGGSELLRSVCSSPTLSDSMKQEPESMSPDTLFIMLRFQRKFPKGAFESGTGADFGNPIDIFKKENLLRFLPCLKESTSSHPRVHPVWDPLLELLFSEDVCPKSSKKNKRSSETLTNFETRLVTFWSSAVDGSLLTSSHERKHLAMQLLLKFLPRLPAPSYVQYILSNNFIQCLLGATTSKGNLLFKSAQNCIADLCKWAEGDDERRIKVVIALQQNSHGKFDNLSKTQAVKRLLSGLTTITGYQETFQALSRLYLSEETVEDDVLVKPSLTSKKQKVSVGQLGGDEGKDIRQDPGQRRWAVDQLRALCQQALGSLPPNIVIEELVSKFVLSLSPVQPFTEEEEESVTTLQLTLLQVSSALSKVEPGENKDRMQAMLSLLVQLLFESRLVPSIAVEIASEITICCKKAFGDQVELEVESQEDGEEPAFMDVLVDVLLSLLAQPSAPIRAAAEQVFKSFSGDLTSSGLTDLLRIVKKNTQRSRHKPVVEVDNQKDDDEDILDAEDSDEESEGGDGTDENDDTDDSDSHEEVNEVQASKGNIKVSNTGKQDKSAGVAEKDEDTEEEEDTENEDKEGETSDLDDETMFRMDKHLANILKQRQQGGGSGTDDSKDAQTQLMHFKFRVLSLLDFFLQKHSGSSLVLTMLPSLLHVFVNSCTTDGNSQVADRVSSILQNKLFKGKQYPKGPEVDQTGLKDLLKKALKLGSRSTVKRVSVMAQATCHWILKVIQGNLKEEKDKDVEDMFSAALEDFFVHKKCRLPSSFFKETFTRNQWLGNCLLGPVLEKCTSARTEYLQFESLQLAGTILGFKNGKFLTRAKQRPDVSSDTMPQPMARVLDSQLPSLSKVIVHHLKAAPSAKAARRIEGIQFCVSALELHQTLYPQKSLAKFVASDGLVASLGAITAPAKSKLNNLVVKVQQLLETK